MKKIGDMRDIVRDATSDIERELITKALAECDGNETNTARKLKISRSTLKKKREELGV